MYKSRKLQLLGEGILFLCFVNNLEKSLIHFRFHHTDDVCLQDLCQLNPESDKLTELFARNKFSETIWKKCLVRGFGAK